MYFIKVSCTNGVPVNIKKESEMHLVMLLRKLI